MNLDDEAALERLRAARVARLATATRLWWVRADGTARIIYDANERTEPIEWLYAKYEQYRKNVPAGPVIWVAIDSLRG